MTANRNKTSRRTWAWILTVVMLLSCFIGSVVTVYAKDDTGAENKAAEQIQQTEENESGIKPGSPEESGAAAQNGTQTGPVEVSLLSDGITPQATVTVATLEELRQAIADGETDITLGSGGTISLSASIDLAAEKPTIIRNGLKIINTAEDITINLTNITLTKRILISGTNPANQGMIRIAGGTIDGIAPALVYSYDSASGQMEMNGGGLYAKNANFTLAGTTITNCSAPIDYSYTAKYYGSGGGVYASGCNITLINADITRNSSYQYGGGIYAKGGSLTIVSCSVDNNTSGQQGAGIYAADLAFRMSDGYIQDNTLTDDASNNTFGAGVCLFRSTFYMDGGSICNNKITDGLSWGGGVYFGDGVTDVTITGIATITSNTAENGGGMYFADAATVKISGNAQISLNVAEGSGGAIAKNIQDDAHPLDITISGNAKFDGNSGLQGGGFRVSNATITINGGTFKNNISSHTSCGGFITSGSSTHVIINGGYFNGNRGAEGGVIGLSEINPDKTKTSLTVTGGEFVMNSSKFGSVFNCSTTTTISGGKFYDNSESLVTSANVSYGGVIYGGSEVTISGGEFYGNSVTREGGVIYGVTTLTIKNDGESIPLFYNNSAPVGSVISNVGTLNLEGGEFYNNRFTGGLDANAAIYIKDGSLLMSGGYMHDNAGNIYLKDTAAEFTGGTIEDNLETNTNGTLLYAEGETVTLNGTTFGPHTGTGIYISGAESVVFKGGKVDAEATKAGAAADVGIKIVGTSSARTPVTISDSFLLTRQASNALVLTYADVTMSAGKITGNFDSAVTGTNATFTMTGGELSANTALTKGGAVYFADDSQVVIEGGKIEDNTAILGGGIYASNIEIKNGTIFDGNSATHGGGIYHAKNYETNNTLKLSGAVSFRNNTATGNGGGIYIENVNSSGVSSAPQASFPAGGTLTFSGNTAIELDDAVEYETLYNTQFLGTVALSDSSSKLAYNNYDIGLTGATFELAAAASPAKGTVTVYRNGAEYSGTSFEVGDTVAVVVNSFVDGYTFSSWSYSGVQSSAATETMPTGAYKTSFTMPAGNVSVTANLILPQPYALTVTAKAEGTAAAKVDDIDHTSGTNVMSGSAVVAVATVTTDGYEFDKWVVTGITLEEDALSAATLSFNMPNSAVTIEAQFRKIQKELTVAADPIDGGIISMSIDGVPGNVSSVPVGSTVSITVTGRDSYVFDAWEAISGYTLNGSEGATITFTMPNEDVSLVAKMKVQSTPPIIPAEPEKESYIFSANTTFTFDVNDQYPAKDNSVSWSDFEGMLSATLTNQKGENVPFTLSCSDYSSALFDTIGTKTVVITAAFGEGKTLQEVVTINIVDRVKPVITLPRPQIVVYTNNPVATIEELTALSKATALDNYDGAVAVVGRMSSINFESIAWDVPSEYAMVLTATDSSGNKSQILVTLLVREVDGEPTVELPEDWEYVPKGDGVWEVYDPDGEYLGDIGYVDDEWVWLDDEQTPLGSLEIDEDGNINTPKTGDSANLRWFVAAAIVSLLLIAAMLMQAKTAARRKKTNS